MQFLGATTSNVWTRRDAVAVLTRKRIDALRYDGSWRDIYPRTFTDSGTPLTPVQWAMAGVLVSGGILRDGLLDGESPESLRAVACGRDAARVWGIPLIDDDDPATGALDKHHHDTAVWRDLQELRSRPVVPDDPPDVLHRHQLQLDRRDVVQHPSGLWLTVPTRTLYDLTELLSHEALVCALDAAAHAGMVSAADIDAMAARHKGWRNAPAFRAAVAAMDARAESPHESLTRLLLKPGWPGLEPQVVLRDEEGIPRARFDHADEELQLAVESDGKRVHSGEISRARDTRRDSWAESRGWHTERVTWFDVRRRAQATRNRVLAVAARRRALRLTAA